jgi:hypothetical protein
MNFLALERFKQENSKIHSDDSEGIQSLNLMQLILICGMHKARFMCTADIGRLQCPCRHECLDVL